MSTLTARIDEALFEETKKMAQREGVKLSEYVRIALKSLNNKNKKHARYQRLQKDSLAVSANSKTVNADFSITDEDLFDD